MNTRNCLILIGAFLAPVMASALTITQTRTAQGEFSGVGSGIAGGFSDIWEFDAFAIEGAQLTSVDFSIEYALNVHVGNNNIFPHEIAATARFDLDTSVLFLPSPSGASFPSLSATYIGETVIVPAFGHFDFDASVAGSGQASYAEPDILTFFSTPGGSVRVLSLGRADTRFGGTNGTETVNYSLTYNYTVPDASSTLLLLGVSSLGVLAARRGRR